MYNGESPAASAASAAGNPSESEGGKGGEDDPVAVLQVRDMFGCADGPSQVTVVAKTRVRALSFPTEVFARLPRVGSDILRVLRYRPFIQASLAKNNMFRDLYQDQIAVIASCVSGEITLAKNQTLIYQGDTTDRSLYIIRKGSVRVQLSKNNPPIELTRLGPGSCVGEMALLFSKPRSADVIANEPSSVLRITKEEFDDAMARYPSIRFIFVALANKRVDDVARVNMLPSSAGLKSPMHFNMPPPSPPLKSSGLGK